MFSRLALAPSTLLFADTRRQARASGITAMMLAVTAVCTLLCLSVKISADSSLNDREDFPLFIPDSLPRPGTPEAAISPEAKRVIETDIKEARKDGFDIITGQVSLGFGAISFDVSRERVDAVRFLETVLGGGVAGTFGLLLALVWTAGFMPTFLEPGAASVLLAKPISRNRLLLGKYAAVLTFMGVQVALFVALTWTALGIRTGIWDAAYLWCVPLILLQFSIYYGASVLLAVTTRSTVACVFGSVLFWLLSWGVNYGSVMARTLPDSQSLSPTAIILADASYWISPKPIDAALILFDTLDADHHFEKPEAFKLLEVRRSYSPQASVASSMLLAAVLLGLACHEFKETDY